MDTTQDRAAGAAPGGAGPQKCGRRAARGENGRAGAASRRGFSLAELLVVLGIVMLLAGMLAPSLGAARARSRGAAGVAAARSLHVGLEQHARDHADLPPVLAKPAWPEPVEYVFDDVAVSGRWFDHGAFAAAELAAGLDAPDTVLGPANPDPPALVTRNGRPVRRGGDFSLSSTLYADPAFFKWETQTGPAQWRAQRLGTIQFPSDKGVLWQSRIFTRAAPAGMTACCVGPEPAPVAFADGSAGEHEMRRLRPGMVNLYASFISPEQDPVALPGVPVDGTFDGVRGRDR